MKNIPLFTSQSIVVESLAKFIADDEGDGLWKALKLKKRAKTFYDGSKVFFVFWPVCEIVLQIKSPKRSSVQFGSLDENHRYDRPFIETSRYFCDNYMNFISKSILGRIFFSFLQDHFVSSMKSLSSCCCIYFAHVSQSLAV